MKHGSYSFGAGLLVCLCVLAVVHRLGASSGSASTPSASVTWVLDDETGSLTYEMTYSQSGPQYGGVELYVISPYTSVIYRNALQHGTGFGGSVTLSQGVTYRFNARTFGAGNVVLFEDNSDFTWGGPPEKRVRLDLTNPSAIFPAKFKIFQDGVDTGVEIDVAPGQSKTETVIVPGSSVIEVAAYVVGASRDGPAWVRDEEAVTELGPVETESGQSHLPTTENPPPTVKYKSPLIPWIDFDPNLPKSVWEKDEDTSDVLTKNTFRQGINMVNTIGQSQLGVLDAIKKNTKDTADNTKKVADRMDSDAELATFFDNVQSGLEAQVSGAVTNTQTAAQAALDAFNSDLASRGINGNIPGAGDPGSAPGGSIALRANSATVINVPKNPFAWEGFGGALATVAAIVRRMIAWAIAVSFLAWAFGRIREMVQGLFQITVLGTSLSDALNSVKVGGFGGGIGYAARLSILTVLVPLIIALPVGIMATMTAGLPWSDLNTTMQLGAGGAASGMVGDAIALANVVVPWVMLLTVPIYYFVVEYLLFPTQFFWSVFFKLLPS